MTTAYITDTRYSAHNLAGHPETAERMTAIHKLLHEYAMPRRMLELVPEEPAHSLLRAVHTDDYLRLLEWSETQRGMQLTSDTYVLPASYQIAKLSAGAAVRAVDAVMTGEADNALACSRPPGHHAKPDMGMGFCLLANVALAARHAQRAYGLKRVLIVDYDVHHGNGTQEIFDADPDVVFLSTHQHPWYPMTGVAEAIGVGDAQGTKINVPLPAGVGDHGFAAVYESIVWPVARRTRPELIIVSAGFDAHWADPLGTLKLGLKGYDHLTRQLMAMADALCDGKIIFALEGGYNTVSLSHGVLNVAYALLGDSALVDPLGPAKGLEEDVQSVIDNVRQIHGL